MQQKFGSYMEKLPKNKILYPNFEILSKRFIFLKAGRKGAKGDPGEKGSAGSVGLPGFPGAYGPAGKPGLKGT